MLYCGNVRLHRERWVFSNHCAHLGVTAHNTHTHARAVTAQFRADTGNCGVACRLACWVPGQHCENGIERSDLVLWVSARGTHSML